MGGGCWGPGGRMINHTEFSNPPSPPAAGPSPASPTTGRPPGREGRAADQAPRQRLTAAPALGPECPNSTPCQGGFRGPPAPSAPRGATSLTAASGSQRPLSDSAPPHLLPPPAEACSREPRQDSSWHQLPRGSSRAGAGAGARRAEGPVQDASAGPPGRRVPSRTGSLRAGGTLRPHPVPGWEVAAPTAHTPTWAGAQSRAHPRGGRLRSGSGLSF